MDFDALYHANFKLLDDAVTDWGHLVDNLLTLKTKAEDGLHKAANKADWSGLNSQVTKRFIGKTAGEFADAHTQATTVHNILRDTRGELKKYKGQLEEAVERGRKQNITVIGYDGGFTVTSNVPPEGRAHTDKDNQHDITALRDEIEKILKNAAESDSSANEVLKAIADQSEMGFSDASYKDRDDAAAALKEAEDLAKLAKKDPEDLTAKDFDRINAGLQKYKNDELFSERFATALGPKKTLEFWTGVTNPYENRDLYLARKDQLDDLQKNLSLTLASASQSDSAAMADWKRTMIDSGDKRLGPNGSGPMGFQVMSNLMRAGNYDDTFMTQYGDALMKTERHLTGKGEHGNNAWQHMGSDQRLNFMGKDGGDSGDDPLTGYLKGLSNSPDAATEFFNQEYVSKEDPDNPFEHDTDGDGKMGKKELSNFQYLFEERDWPQETSLEGDELHTGQNNLALALEAATTGHPAGELPTKDTPAHNAEQSKLFESIVASVSEDNGRLTDSSYMSDSMGQIASEYLPDISRAQTDVDPHPARNDRDGLDAWKRIENLYPVAGSSAEMNHHDVSRFLFAVGQNPEGYAAVEVGQKSYMANLMDYHLRPDLPESQRPHRDLELTVRAIAEHSGEVSGSLAMGRQQGVSGPADLEDKAYDHAVGQWKGAIAGTVGTGIGVGTSFIASPAVGAGVGGAAGTVTSAMLEELFKDAEGSAKDNAGPKMGEDWENGQKNNMTYTRRAASEAAHAHGLKNPGDAASWAEIESRKGFLAGGSYMERVAPELITDI
ncbi:hypothetical protein [Streptomyces longispororuber]|uniref:hypothetical protein n=1 Tax=Streptomyces longispororuber TaxID=68230 RepID=UPI0021099C43|nr:hypothetical protein [Streptomyces longispororuber]MCQ4210991.1 hypothetical protein [Streptomyces longispororuber]